MERVNPGDVLDCSLYVVIRIAEEEPEEEPEVDPSSNHNFSFRYEYKCSFVPLRTTCTEADSLIVRQESLCLSDPQLKQLVTSKYILRLDCSSAGGPRRRCETAFLFHLSRTKVSYQ